MELRQCSQLEDYLKQNSMQELKELIDQGKNKQQDDNKQEFVDQLIGMQKDDMNIYCSHVCLYKDVCAQEFKEAMNNKYSGTIIYTGGQNEPNKIQYASNKTD